MSDLIWSGAWLPSSLHYQYVTDQSDWQKVADKVDFKLNKCGDTLEVIFRCTASDSDWKDDLDFYPRNTVQAYKDSGFKVHEGLYNQYLAVRSIILDACYSSDVKNIYVAGYSLGGFLTQFAVQDIVYHFSKRSPSGDFIYNCKSIVTSKNILGISYEGGRSFCMNRKVAPYLSGHLFNVKNHCDPVIHQPLKFMFLPFIHVSFFPFSVSFVPSLNISFWQDYGTVAWIGSRFRLYPCQHNPDQIEKALKEKYSL